MKSFFDDAISNITDKIINESIDIDKLKKAVEHAVKYISDTLTNQNIDIRVNKLADEKIKQKLGIK